MGCNLGSHVKPSLSPYLMVASQPDHDQDTPPGKIEFYDLYKCRLKTTVKLPVNPNNRYQRLSRGFKVCTHPVEPKVYIAGGVYLSSNGTQSSRHVCEIIMHEDPPLFRKLPDLPSLMKNFHIEIVSNDVTTTLYLFDCDTTMLYGLNLSGGRDLRHWNILEKITHPPGGCESILTTKNSIIVIGGGEVYRFTESDATWDHFIESDYPRGMHTILGEDIISYDRKQDRLYKCDISTGLKTLLEHADTSTFRSCSQMLGIDDKYMYMLKKSDNIDFHSLMEYNKSTNSCAMAGHLQSCAESYQLGIFHPKS